MDIITGSSRETNHMYVTIPVLYLSFFHPWLCSFVNLQEGALEGKAISFLWLSVGINVMRRFEFKSFVLSGSWSHWLIFVSDHHGKLRVNWTHYSAEIGAVVGKDSVVTTVCQILSLPSNKGHLASDNFLAHLRDPLTPSGSICKALGSSCPPHPHIIHVSLYESSAIQIQDKLWEWKKLKSKSKLTIWQEAKM